MDQLKELIKKIPITALFILGLLYLGWDYYNFLNDDASPLTQVKTQITALKQSNVQDRKRIQQAEEFYKNLDQKRSSLRAMAKELDEMKVILSEDLDISAFVKLVVTEARKVGLKVLSIKPDELKKNEYYAEQAFDLSFQGVYVQLLVFLERLSNVERIVRVDQFEVKREGEGGSSYVSLSGKVQIKTYRYLGSKADDVGKNPGVPSNAAPAQGAPAGGAGEGAPPGGAPPAAKPPGGAA